MTLPCSATPGKLDLSCSGRFRLALCGRAPPRGRAVSSIQFEHPSEAERAQVRALISRAHALPKWARAATSSAAAGPSRFRRLFRAPQWGWASSSGRFECSSEAEASSSGQLERPSEAEADRAAYSNAPKKPKWSRATNFAHPNEAKRARGVNFERPTEAERARVADSR